MTLSCYPTESEQYIKNCHLIPSYLIIQTGNYGSPPFDGSGQNQRLEFELTPFFVKPDNFCKCLLQCFLSLLGLK